MARLRTIKPSFFTNEDLGDCQPLARLAFAGLWCLADREGRLEDRPKRIKAEILPFDDVDMDALLAELADRGFIERYEADGLHLIAVTKFARHQNPHVREAKSTLPPPPSAPDEHSAGTVLSPVQHPRTIGNRTIGDLGVGSGDPPTPRSAGGRSRRNSHVPPEDAAALRALSEVV